MPHEAEEEERFNGPYQSQPDSSNDVEVGPQLSIHQHLGHLHTLIRINPGKLIVHILTYLMANMFIIEDFIRRHVDLSLPYKFQMQISAQFSTAHIANNANENDIRSFYFSSSAVVLNDLHFNINQTCEKLRADLEKYTNLSRWLQT